MTAPGGSVSRQGRGVPLDERGDPRQYGRPGGPPPPPGVAPASVQYYPPWIQPPDVYQDFNFQTANGTSVAANTTIVPPELTFLPPQGYRGVIREVSLFVDNPNVTLAVNFILLVGNAPVPGWTRSSFPRIATNISIDYDSHIRFREGQQVSWQIVNLSGVSWTVGIRYAGWIYPVSEEVRIMGRAT